MREKIINYVDKYQVLDDGLWHTNGGGGELHKFVGKN